jgi:hypothetical protein
LRYVILILDGSILMSRYAVSNGGQMADFWLVEETTMLFDAGSEYQARR